MKLLSYRNTQAGQHWAGCVCDWWLVRPGLAWKDKFCWVLRKSGLALSDKEDWVHLNLNTRPYLTARFSLSSVSNHFLFSAQSFYKTPRKYLDFSSPPLLQKYLLISWLIMFIKITTLTFEEPENYIFDVRGRECRQYIEQLLQMEPFISIKRQEQYNLSLFFTPPHQRETLFNL